MKRLILAFTLLIPSISNAQVVNNPTAITFNSPDHLTTDGNNNNILSGYRVEFVREGATAATVTVDVARTVVVTVSPGLYSIPYSSLPSYPIGVTFRTRLTSLGVNNLTSDSTLSSNSFTKPVPAPAAVTNVTNVSR